MKSRRIARPSGSRLPIIIFLGVLLLATLSTPILGQNENERLGFSSSHVFETGYAGENIDLLNGNLTFTIPIGPKYKVNDRLEYQLQLNYNSKVWEFLDDSGSISRTQLIGESPFGLGFSLTFGRLYKDAREDFSTVWFFVTPDGNRHEMGDGSSSPLITNDLSYFKPTRVPSETREGAWMVVVTDRQGIRYTLDHEVSIPLNTLCNPCLGRELNVAYGGWYVTRIEDTVSGFPDDGGLYPNRVEITYDNTVGYGQCISGITDSVGRSITFQNDLMVPDEVRSARTKEITLPRYAGQTAVNNLITSTYRFTYSYTTMQVPKVALDPPTERDMRDAVRLESIQLPSNLVMSFGYVYTTEPEHSELPIDTESVVFSRTLPMNETGDRQNSRMVYYYFPYAYLNRNQGRATTWLSDVARVTLTAYRKELYLGTGSEPAASWRYDRTAPVNRTNPEMVKVTETAPEPTESPLFNETVHFFLSSRKWIEGMDPGPEKGVKPFLSWKSPRLLG